MTEPQELRSVDELFRNTFNNLPETPANSGWDTPSDRVWQHVHDNIQTPRSGWSLQSIMLLTGFVVVLVVGLYFAFSTPATVEVAPVNQTSAPAATSVDMPSIVVPEQSETTVAVVPEVAHKQIRTPHVTRPATQKIPAEPVVEPPARINPVKDIPRSTGAVPLPGSKTVTPNTTEERKAEHARQMEQAWQKPLTPLPLPLIEKVRD